MDDKKIINLGEKQEKILVFGGVYSNLQALEALIHFAKENSISAANCINTGDLVGYCGQPNECVKLLKEWGCHSILGNVEIQLMNGEDNCACDFEEGSRCDVLSNQWYPKLQKEITEESIQFFQSLPHHITFSMGDLNVGVAHGSIENTSEFIFHSTPWENKQKNFKKLGVDIIIAGHCGLPFYQKKIDKYWVNPGVIGMPANNGKVKTWFAIVSIQNKEVQVEFHELNYNHFEANKMMISNQYPKAYANTLLSGIWDNMDILPESEKFQKGKKLKLNFTE